MGAGKRRLLQLAGCLALKKSASKKGAIEVVACIKFNFSRGLDALPLAKELRRKVFITEQGFQNEFDDMTAPAWHVR